VEAIVWKTAALWESPNASVSIPESLAQLTSRLHEFVPDNLAIAIVAAAARMRNARRGLPHGANDLVFKLADPLRRLFGTTTLRVSEVLSACVAKREALLSDVIAAVGNFVRSDCAGAKTGVVEVLRRSKLMKPVALPGERPILSELDMLLGPTFRAFCESCERRNATESAKFAPLLREQAIRARLNIGQKQNSTLWYECAEPVAKHIAELVDEESNQSEAATTPALKLATSVIKLDLSKVDREMKFSCRLTNRGRGLARDVEVTPELDGTPVDLKLVNPSTPFEVGGESDQIVTFALKLKEPCEFVTLSLRWHSTTLRGKHHIDKDTLTVSQQRTQPDWDRLRLDPPYLLNAVKTRDRLFGRDAILNHLVINASAGTSTFIWGAKRVGKTFVVQVLERELRNTRGFVTVYLRMGELAALHEGQIAYTIADRLTQRLNAQHIVLPQEGAFGAGLSRLIPFI
jgi:hypothetical protein